MRRLLLVLALVTVSWSGARAVAHFQVFRPPDHAGAGPAVLVIPGGGWQQAEPRREAAFARRLAARGFVAIAVGHRPAPFPAPFEDVRDALRSVRADAESHGVDPRRIGLVGKSSGGHLAALVGLTERVQAVVLLCAPTDLLDRAKATPTQRRVVTETFGTDPKELRRYSPLELIRPGAPPFLLIHGELDVLVPARQSVRFQARLRKAGVESELIVLPGVGHDFGSPDGRTPASVEAPTVRFLERRLLRR